MPEFSLNPNNLSKIFWPQVLEYSSIKIQTNKERLIKYLDLQENLRKNMEIQTGSIGASACLCLFSLSIFFNPKTILEIGTYIGKSTISLAIGCEANKNECLIYTCDKNNKKINFPDFENIKIIQHPKKTSSEMLEMNQEKFNKNNIDIFFIDGRLTDYDINFSNYDKTIFVFDDFEGKEKGVSNFDALCNKGFLKTHFLIEPISNEVLEKYGLPWNKSPRSLIAVFIPLKLIKFTLQNFV